MQKHFLTLGHEADLHSVRSQGMTPALDGYDAVLFGAPTYEDGKLETSMRVFITRFSSDLSKYKIGVFGLGNSSYPQFCFSAGVLEEWVTQNKGVLTIPSLKIDGFPDDLKPIQQWVEQFSKA
jgi:flavodoxin I